jgi:hypothetical protein
MATLSTQEVVQVCDRGEGARARGPAQALQGGARPGGEGEAPVPHPADGESAARRAPEGRAGGGERGRVRRSQGQVGEGREASLPEQEGEAGAGTCGHLPPAPGEGGRGQLHQEEEQGQCGQGSEVDGQAGQIVIIIIIIPGIYLQKIHAE